MKYCTILIVFSLFFVRCAQQSGLTGGEKDSTPPSIDSLQQEMPLNGSINFTANSITIFFDELVTLKNPEKQILITPFLDTQPDIYTKGRKLIVDFKAPLNSNTTYIINFGDAITDLTEGNTLKNYKYVFSTGSFIDSLTYSAVVVDGYSKVPLADVLVMLYASTEDSIVKTTKPSYFAATNSKGSCLIENIAQGTYKIIALEDKNSNYLFDQKDERIAFEEERFVAGEESDTVPRFLKIFSDQPETYSIESVTLSKTGKGTLVLNKPLSEGMEMFSDSILNRFIDQKYALSKTRDSLFFWVNPSLAFDQKYSWTVAQSKPFKANLPKPTDTVLTFTTNAAANLKPQEDLWFEFNHPLKEINAEKLHLTTGDRKIDFELVQTAPNRLMIAADFKEDEMYTFEIEPNALLSYYNSVSNDSITALFEKNEANKYGNLFITINAPQKGDYLLELIQNEKIVGRASMNDLQAFNHTFANLGSGKYRLRLVFDKNSNGIWDTGNYFQHIQPERVEYYEDVIDLKRGWDMEIKWELLH